MPRCSRRTAFPTWRISYTSVSTSTLSAWRTHYTIFSELPRRTAGLVAYAAGVYRRVAGTVHRVHPQTVRRLRNDTVEPFVHRRRQEHCRLRRDSVRRRPVPPRRQLLAGHGHEAALPLLPGALRVCCLHVVCCYYPTSVHEPAVFLAQEFTGHSCNKQVPCTEFKCQNKGHCVSDNSNTSFVCKCPPGWDGPFCTKGTTILLLFL